MRWGAPAPREGPPSGEGRTVTGVTGNRPVSCMTRAYSSNQPPTGLPCAPSGAWSGVANTSANGRRNRIAAISPRASGESTAEVVASTHDK